ncbi:MAG: TolC family protein, partial [Candidatus Eremiobacteraeota bacterium]|nr:TolC family protein [Candidatus Eremiobacteraeota bacterium]
MNMLIVLLLMLSRLAWGLTLGDVLDTVEHNHPKLRKAQLELEVAQAKTLEKQGAFDPSIGFYTLTQRYNGEDKSKTFWGTGLAYGYLDRSGLKVQAGYRNHQGSVKSPLSNTGQAGEFFAEMKLPLLRGASLNQKAADEQRALVGEKTAGAYYQLTRLQTLLAAGSAYWGWVASVRQLELVETSLKLAQERLANVAQRVAAGDLARVNQLEAEQTVAKRQELVVKARREVEKAQLKLAYYLWNSQGQPQELPQTAAEELPQPSPLEPAQVAQAEVEALRLRPEVAGLEFALERIAIDEALAKNDQLPQLDLTLSPGIDPSGIGVSVKAGLELVIPLATRGADGRLLAARLKTDQLALEQVETVRTIVLEVRDAASAVKMAVDRYQQASLALTLASQLEEAEKLRFELGEGTL